MQNAAPAACIQCGAATGALVSLRARPSEGGAAVSRYFILFGVATSVAWLAAAGRAPAQEPPALPEGVTHVALPPGEVRLEYVVRGGKPLLRISAGEAVIETRTVFLGDAKAVLQVEATKKGMRYRAKGDKGEDGFFLKGADIYHPGSRIGVRPSLQLAEADPPGTYIITPAVMTVDELKAGSIYVTTPSIIFDGGPALAKEKPKP
jgi:hypothetical protein